MIFGKFETLRRIDLARKITDPHLAVVHAELNLAKQALVNVEDHWLDDALSRLQREAWFISRDIKFQNVHRKYIIGTPAENKIREKLYKLLSVSFQGDVRSIKKALKDELHLMNKNGAIYWIVPAGQEEERVSINGFYGQIEIADSVEKLKELMVKTFLFKL